MNIRIVNGLPYSCATICYQQQCIELENVLIDTGSASTIFSVDKMLVLGLEYAADDAVHRIHGVGGSEFVFSKRVNSLFLDELVCTNFEIEVGAMNYGFELDGIVGVDFLVQVGAVIDLSRMEILPA